MRRVLLVVCALAASAAASAGLVGCGSSEGGAAQALPEAGAGPDSSVAVDSGGPERDAGGGIVVVDGDAPVSNHSFDTARRVPVNPTAALDGKLADAKTKDYYSFKAKKGERLLIETVAQALSSTGNGFEPSIIDTVVTVYDPSRKPIAQSDDEHPNDSSDSSLMFVALADGLYYYTVEDCNSAYGSHCASPDGIRSFEYRTYVLDVDRTTRPETFAGSGQDGTPAKARDVTYATYPSGGPGSYNFSIIDGQFSNAGETHVFRFIPPTDVKAGADLRVHADFYVQPTGTNNGNGSTSNVTSWVTDESGAVIAKADEANYGDSRNPTNGPLALSVPVTLGKTYWLYVQSDAVVAGPADYYFLVHWLAASWLRGTLEREGATAKGANDSLESAETLPKFSWAPAGAYGVDGDLVAGDEDWFAVDALAGATKATFGCDGARVGSGLLGLSAELFDANHKSLGAFGPEPLTSDVGVTAAVSQGHHFLKVSAAGQAASVNGTFYSCWVSFR